MSSSIGTAWNNFNEKANLPMFSEFMLFIYYFFGEGVTRLNGGRAGFNKCLWLRGVIDLPET
jgi:hypothetical protein